MVDISGIDSSLRKFLIKKELGESREMPKYLKRVPQFLMS